MAQISISHNEIAAFCRRNHIRRLAFFGSVLRDDFGPRSDVDVLVEFEPGHIPGLSFFRMEDELSQILGRKVDLNTPHSLSRYFRDVILLKRRCSISIRRSPASFRHMLDHAREAVAMVQGKLVKIWIKTGDSIFHWSVYLRSSARQQTEYPYKNVNATQTYRGLRSLAYEIA